MLSFTAPLSLATTTTELRSGQRDLLAFIREICDRIDALEPHIQAFLPEPERVTRLLAEATHLRQRFPDPEQRPPLFGALLGVKDIFRSDGFSIQAGSQLPSTLFAGTQASSVSRLREAGALVLAKTVTAEFAANEPGPTRNPHHLEHTPGGSSSGSAAAVAAGVCSLALGTQTTGSVIRPAAFCGIVGFKPTYGRIAADGLIPCAVSVDTIGLLTQDIASIVLVAPLLCPDWKETTAMTTPVLAVPDGPYLAQASSEALDAFEQQLMVLKHAGYTIKRVATLNDIQDINLRHQQLTSAEMALVHQTWFANHAPLYSPRTAEMIRAGQKLNALQISSDRAGRALLRLKLETIMKQEKIDLWVCPAAVGPAPEGIAQTGDPAMNLPWTHAGMPTLTIPAGTAANSLPLGLQIIGPAMADEQLVTWAGPLADVLAKAYLYGMPIIQNNLQSP